MTLSTTVAAKVKGAATDAARSSKHDLLCRAGYAAHGVVYLLVGAMAVDAAIGGAGSGVRGEREAISRLGQGTMGTVLLTLLGLGLGAYSYMRLWQGLANSARRRNDAQGLGVRVGRVASGIAAAGLAFFSLSLAWGWFGGGGLGGGSGEHGPADMTARIMAWPGGRWIVGAIGAGVCIAAFAQLVVAVQARFLRELALSAKQERWVKPVGRAGYAARFVVFLIVGGFLLAAAYWAEPGQARGLGGALRALQGQPYGPWLLGLTGAGLVAFAVVRGVYARYAILPGR